MVITSKTHKNDITAKEIIERGGSEKNVAKKEDDYTIISLRIPKKMLKEMDSRRAFGSRNTWILEAIDKFMSQ